MADMLRLVDRLGPYLLDYALRRFGLCPSGASGCADAVRDYSSRPNGDQIEWSDDRGKRMVTVMPPEGRKVVFVAIS